MISGAMVFLLAVSVTLAVSAVGASLFAVWRSRALALAADERARTSVERCETTVEALRKSVEGLTSRLRDLPVDASVGHSGSVKPGLNLSRRSQVLRMHRSGEPPERIAAAMGVPLQEVDLLIKVHRMVIKTM